MDDLQDTVNRPELWASLPPLAATCQKVLPHSRHRRDFAQPDGLILLLQLFTTCPE